MLDSIRQSIRERDQLSDADIDNLFRQAREDLADGIDPEDVVADVFGLEPDFVFDTELMHMYENVIQEKKNV